MDNLSLLRNVLGTRVLGGGGPAKLANFYNISFLDMDRKTILQVRLVSRPVNNFPANN